MTSCLIPLTTKHCIFEFALRRANYFLHTGDKNGNGRISSVECEPIPSDD